MGRDEMENGVDVATVTAAGVGLASGNLFVSVCVLDEGWGKCWDITYYQWVALCLLWFLSSRMWKEFKQKLYPL